MKIVANARARYEADPTPVNFRVWRDASDIAIRWHRVAQTEGAEFSAEDVFALLQD